MGILMEIGIQLEMRVSSKLLLHMFITLKILGDFKDYCKIMVGDLSSLVHAYLTFRVLEVIDKSTVKDHLRSICCANELMVPSWFIEVISMLVLKRTTFHYCCWRANV
ncbi:hypothetical protein HAX54_032176 [Datura stramonium]|uniref:Uncharacterized protein n=1 Tax=Datura stramonium TaxID=4076 RepID=A0ABS8VBC4_DATST|nr:hypothetical protein [Datura stramonium]